MARPDLVIFDCDGVLVDTEEISIGELLDVLRAHGRDLDMTEGRARFMGRSMEAIVADVETRDGIDLGPDFLMRWNADLPRIFAGGVAPVRGVSDVIDRLDATGVPLCVASSGSIARMHITLGSAGLLDRLKPVLFSSAMVANGKPAPDLFLHAASTMGHRPDRCAVIEDSVYGVIAARAAGMATFGYVGDPANDADALADAGATPFSDMTQLPALLGLPDDR